MVLYSIQLQSAVMVLIC